ncbi:MAG: di-heme oxidoredictase family protein [Polyangiaceae bacterium]
MFRPSPLPLSFVLSLVLAGGGAALVPVAGCSSAGPGDTAGTDAGTADAPVDEVGVEKSGGETTVFDETSNAFTFAARNLSDAHRDAFALGDHFFNRNWVTAPASIEGNDGLGPTFNATSCSACHFRDGRGAPPRSETEDFLALLVRLSIPGENAHGGPVDEPNYGGQFNPSAILGVPAEGKVRVGYDEVPGTFGDGEAYALRKPVYTFSDLAFGPFAAGTMTSPRVAPAMIGLGLLQAIDEATIVGMADPDDTNGDGISGRENRVWSDVRGRVELGRFGWKANQPDIRQQTAGASLGDMGITTSLYLHENCPSVQTACRAAPSGGTATEPELSDQKLDAMTSYGLTVAVPARRRWTEPTVRDGEKVFAKLGCASCHVTKLVTGSLEGFPELSNQTIRPYTDMLLHDMGDGLADGRPDFRATGNEWRTTPLWGMGLQRVVAKHTFLLHDGRARDAKEAILWHGGEAEVSKEAFRNAPKAERDALLGFLDSL